jgi:glucose/arabinose dehydrogenase
MSGLTGHPASEETVALFKRVTRGVLVFALCAVGWIADAQEGHQPGTFVLMPQVFAATGLQGPRFMAWSPDGVLHVANMRVPGENRGQIIALPDRDLDGVADEAVVVASGFRYVHSLAFYKGDLYVADTHEVVLFRDVDGDGTYEERQVLAVIPTGGTHNTRTIVFDEVNDRFFLSIGTSCDMCREGDPERGTILQFNADGTGRQIYARGLRNSVGLALHPRTNQLWATNNGHNREGSTLPPEVINIVRADGFYGARFALSCSDRVLWS